MTKPLEAMAKALHAAIRADRWPAKIHDIVDAVNAASDEYDLSTEQCVALGVFLAASSPPVAGDAGELVRPTIGRATRTLFDAAEMIVDWRHEWNERELEPEAVVAFDALENAVTDFVGFAEEHALASAPVPSGEAVAYRPAIIHFDEGGFNEFVTEDIATITGQMEAANVERIYRMDQPRELIGFRIYDAAPSHGETPVAWRWHWKAGDDSGDDWVVSDTDPREGATPTKVARLDIASITPLHAAPQVGVSEQDQEDAKYENISRAEFAETVARYGQALDLLIRSVRSVLVELKPGQSLHPAGATKTNILIEDVRAAERALSTSTSQAGGGKL